MHCRSNLQLRGCEDQNDLEVVIENINLVHPVFGGVCQHQQRFL